MLVDTKWAAGAVGDQAHFARLLLGVESWNEWRQREPDIQPDLSGIVMPEADLSNAILAGANLRGADLHGADLTRAELSGADLAQANLRGTILRAADLNWAYLRQADLWGADLTEALLEDTDLTGADLSTADLSGADLQGANLQGASVFGSALAGTNLHEASIGSTRFGDVDLGGALGLSSVKHTAPSSIGIDALYRSKGEIPEAFLRGAGIPDAFIRFALSLPQKPERAFSCFICHSAKDKRFCDRLYADLQGYGIRTWYAPQDASRGKRFLAQLAVHTRMFDKVILICSRHSLQTREVLKEIEDALRREAEARRPVLFPIRLDNYLLKDWRYARKAAVVEKVIADFRGWNRSAVKYETGVKQLLDALRAS